MQSKLLTLTEVGMLIYWILALAVVVGLLNIPAEYMYSDYENPLIVAWNWSFFPLDVIFAIAGLYSRFGNLNAMKKELLASLSLSLMFCAGLMALSFWIINRDFNLTWWLLNLWLLLLSSWFLFKKFNSGSNRLVDKVD